MRTSSYISVFNTFYTYAKKPADHITGIVWSAVTWGSRLVVRCCGQSPDVPLSFSSFKTLQNK